MNIQKLLLIVIIIAINDFLLPSSLPSSSLLKIKIKKNFTRIHEINN
jgi:hypothetical protein